MVQIGRAQNIDDLIARVGAKLDLTITANSTPNREQVVQWLNDGALLLARLLPLHRLGGLQQETSYEAIREYVDVDEDDILRLATVKKYGIECKIMEQRQLSMISTRMPLAFTSRTPACAVSGDTGSVRLMFYPVSPGNVTVRAIKRPTAYEDSSSWEPDAWSLPAELELSVIDYAVIQGKVQDEEPEQANMLMQHWQGLVGIEAKTDSIGVD